MSTLLLFCKEGEERIYERYYQTITATFLMIMMICILAACGNDDGYKVKNENKASNIYTCPNDNMFGLEKVVVFDDQVVVVFDKEICDSSKFNGIEEAAMYSKIIAYTNLTNVKKSDDSKSYYETKDDKYIVYAVFEYDEADKMDPDKDVTVESVNVMGRYISFNDGNLELFFSVMGGECSNDYTQIFNKEDGKWGEIKEEFKLYPMTVKE